jgi:hypothetical protein
MEPGIDEPTDADGGDAQPEPNDAKIQLTLLDIKVLLAMSFTAGYRTNVMKLSSSALQEMAYGYATAIAGRKPWEHIGEEPEAPASVPAPAPAPTMPQPPS